MRVIELIGSLKTKTNIPINKGGTRNYLRP